MKIPKVGKLTLLVIALVVAGRVYFHVIPAGASVLPYLLASVRGQPIVSPDGKIVLSVRHNDAGAAHSGNHWTWVIVESLLFGKRVVAQGYCGSEQAVDGIPIPVQWRDGSSFSIQFLDGRYSHGVKVVPVSLQ